MTVSLCANLLKFLNSYIQAVFYFETEQKLAVDHVQVGNRLTFATLVTPQAEDRMLNRNQSAHFLLKSFPVVTNALQMANT